MDKTRGAMASEERTVDECKRGGGLFGSSPAAGDGGDGTQPAAVTQYKVIVAGDGGTGKTAWLAKLLGNDFPTAYHPTLGVAVQSIDEESLRFSMWDCAGQEKFGGLRDGYFIGGQAAVIFFDLSSRVTFSHVTHWHGDITRVCGNVPIIVVGSKCELAERVVAPETIAQFVQAHGFEYVELSAKEDINTRKPLELLAAKLTKATSAGAPEDECKPTTTASTGFSWPSEPKCEPKVEAGFGLFGGAAGPTSGGGGLFGTSTTGGSQLGGASAHGLFSNSSGGGFSNTSAPTSTGGGGLFTGRSLFGSSPAGGGVQPAAVTQYKVIVAGDGGTGKTAWLAKLLGDDFPTAYNPTLGVAVRSIDEESPRFSMWDCAGQEKFGGLRDGYFIGGQAAVIFFDLGSRVTFSHVTHWHGDITRVCGNVPIIVVGAKCDLTERVVAPETVSQFVEMHGLEYVELSAKEDINTRKPLELLAARLTNATSAGAK